MRYPELTKKWPTWSLLTLTTCIGIGAVQAGPKEITDNGIENSIENEYLSDNAIPFNDIDVVAQDGIVTLEGIVDNILAKERATAVARTVKGVRSVVNLLEVRPVAGMTSKRLEADVDSALITDPATESYEIAVNATNDGVVTLSGEVESWQEMMLSGKVVRTVSGVTEVRNRLSIEYPDDRPDFEIRPEVERRLEWDTLVDDGLIDVRADDGIVYLTGTAGSAAEKNRAITDAWVGGVDRVEADGLKVERWARDENMREGKYKVKTDGQIKDALQTAFLYDPRVNSYKVNTDVDEGYVTLKGIVDNIKSKQSAEIVTRNTVGVTGVQNLIKVRSDEVISDDELTQLLEERIIRDPYLEPYEVSLMVDSGVVHLYGQVDDYFEKLRAENLAYAAKGVKEVKNQIDAADKESIVIQNPYVDSYDTYIWHGFPYYPTTLPFNNPTKRDPEIARNITWEFFWSPYVDAEDITIEVYRGVAKLKGDVESLREKNAATENAMEGGAVSVENDLVVTGSE